MYAFYAQSAATPIACELQFSSHFISLSSRVLFSQPPSVCRAASKPQCPELSWDGLPPCPNPNHVRPCRSRPLPSRTRPIPPLPFLFACQVRVQPVGWPLLSHETVPVYPVAQVHEEVHGWCPVMA